MRAWRRDGLPESGRRADILIAIEEHDHGWTDVDTAPIVESGSGRILDFVGIPDDVRRGVWPRGVRRLMGTPYAAALVAQHAIHVYRRYRTDGAWLPFFAEMEAAREQHLAAAGIRNHDDLRRDYSLLRVADLVSLTFCCGWTETQHDDSGSGYRIHLEGTTLTISPDPFGGREVALEVKARELPAMLNDEAAVRHAFGAAAMVTVAGTATGPR